MSQVQSNPNPVAVLDSAQGTNQRAVSEKIQGLVEEMRGLSQDLQSLLAEIEAANQAFADHAKNKPGKDASDEAKAKWEQKNKELVGSVQQLNSEALRLQSRIEEVQVKAEHAERVEMPQAERKDHQLAEQAIKTFKQQMEAVHKQFESTASKVEDKQRDTSSDLRLHVIKREVQVGETRRTIYSFAVQTSAENTERSGRVPAPKGSGLPDITIP
jgi:hypothetical protein